MTAAALSGGSRVGAKGVACPEGESRVSLLRRSPIRVGDVMTRPPPIVPSHLPMAAARKVAALRCADLLLVEIEGRLVGVLADRALATAPDADLVAAWTTPIASAVRPSTTASRARALLIAHRASCLPVVAGMFVVGIVSRVRIERALSSRSDDTGPVARAAA